MSQPNRWPGTGVQLLPAGTGSLARGLPPVPAGTLFALGDRGGISVAPTARFTSSAGSPQVSLLFQTPEELCARAADLAAVAESTCPQPGEVGYFSDVGLSARDTSQWGHGRR